MRLCLFLKLTISLLSRPKITILLFLHCIRQSSPPIKPKTTTMTRPQRRTFWCWEASGSPMCRQQSMESQQYSLLCFLGGWLWSQCQHEEVLEVSLRRQQFQAKPLRDCCTRQLTEGLFIAILTYLMEEVVMMMKRSLTMWKNYLMPLPLSLTALQAWLMILGSRLKGYISMSYSFWSRNRKVSKYCSWQRQADGWRWYWVGTENVFMVLMNYPLLKNLTRKYWEVSISTDSQATLLPSMSLKLTKIVTALMEGLNILNWQLPPKVVRGIENIGTAFLLSSWNMYIPLQKSRMNIMFDIIAISCGRIVVPLNSSISVKVEVRWEEGQGITNTFSIFFRPTSNYDYPCKTRSNPFQVQLLKPDIVLIFLTLVRIVLVSICHIPPLANMYTNSQRESEVRTGGEVLAQPLSCQGP